MKIIDVSIFKGRNIYSHYPVIKMILDAEKLSMTPTKQIKGFNEWVLQEFPGLKTNHCGLGYEGGFLEKLGAGTYLAHVIEHVILEMQYMAGYNVAFGKTRVLDEPSKSYIVYEYINEVCGLECGKAAIHIINCFLKNKKANVKDILAYIQQVSKDAELGPSTAAIYREAQRRGIPVCRVGHESLIQLGYGKYRRMQQATLTDATSCIAVDISSNKQFTKMLLRDNGIPVPDGKLVFSEISALLAAKQIGTPVAIKPHNGNQGKGVHLNLKSQREIKAAFKDACSHSNSVIVEKFVSGKDFRVLVVGDKVSAVSERRPACVTGDGVHTISELVNIVNQDENRGDHHEKPLTKIKLDTIALKLLKRDKLTPAFVPGKGEIVKLRENGNLSTGGTATDRTDEIHPENAELAVRAASVLGIDIAGIDFVTEDISAPIRETGGVIVEVNTAPGIRMHLYPSEGTSRDVAKDIVEYLYPDNDVLDFPIVSVTGTNGKTTTTRLIAHALACYGKSVGMTSTSGTYINGKCIHKGDDTGALSAKAVLADKSVDAAVLETARGGLIRAGLGYDLADVGVITNIADDHLGLNDINTLEDLAFVKSLVAEAVKDSGYAVLNGDDPMTGYILKRVKANVILFTKDYVKTRSLYKDHALVYVSKGMIMIENDEVTTSVIHVDHIPITKHGSIPCNVENSLAAVAALHALRIPAETIALGLSSFTDNAGRFQLHRLGNCSVLLDYGHNAPGYKAVIDALPSYQSKRLIGVIGMPGDRQDSAMQAVGELCANAFHKIYIKEDVNLRGREKGEVAALLYAALTSRGFPKENIMVLADELDALKLAVSDAQNGDLIVVFYEKLHPLTEYMQQLAGQNHP